MLSKVQRLHIHEFLYQMRKTKSDFFIFLSRNLLGNEGGFDLFVTGKARLFTARILSGVKRNDQAKSDHADVLQSLHADKVAPIALNIPAKGAKC